MLVRRPSTTIDRYSGFGASDWLPSKEYNNVWDFIQNVAIQQNTHSIKFGGEYRRANNNNFTLTPGTFGFASITAFLNDQANAFTANPSNRASRLYANALGFFVTDQMKVNRKLTLDTWQILVQPFVTL